MSQDGESRRGRLSVGNVMIQGFCTLETGPFNIVREGFQVIPASARGSQGDIAKIELIVPLMVDFGDYKNIPPVGTGSTQWYVATHPFLLGPPYPGRCRSAWCEIQEFLQQLLPHLPPDLSIGPVVPAWEDAEFLEEYLAFWSNNRSISFAIIRFDSGIFRNSRHFLMNWQIIQDLLPRDVFSIAWGDISPYFAPLLAYLGFDGMTGLGGEQLAGKNLYAMPYGWVLPKEPVVPSGNIEDPRQLNWETFKGIVKEIHVRTEKGTLREFVELSTHFDNAIATTLRIFDNKNAAYPLPSTRLNKTSQLQCTSVEAYYRPELVLYRHRLGMRYAIPHYKKIIVLLPCAATKPYRNSPSHRKIQTAIQRAAGSAKCAVEELIITSPLGVVPRALEDLYPAAFYDVPVTGHWDETEVQIAVDLLEQLLAKCPQDLPVIALAEGGYLEVCRQLSARAKQQIIILEPAPKLLSESVLGEFASQIRDSLLKYAGDFITTVPLPTNERFQAIADFQFGLEAGRTLFSRPLKIQSSPRYPTRIIDRTTRGVIATQQASGYLRLSIEGARLLVGASLPELGKIIFAGDAISGSSLFAAGVSLVEGEIRPGDFVVILAGESGELLATAEAVVDGNTMLHLRHGAIAKIMEKAR